jgi:hypothetical protein
MRLLAALAVVTLTSAACTTMSADECRGANWFDIGMQDGLAGLQRMDILHEHRCGEQGVKPDAERYRAGWQEGRWEFEARAARDSVE